MERWRSLARERQVGLDIDTQPEAEVEADPALLRRVIDILVDNAIRHTPAHGSVTVSASRSDAHSVVAVQDTGPGLGADLRPACSSASRGRIPLDGGARDARALDCPSVRRSSASTGGRSGSKRRQVAAPGS